MREEAMTTVSTEKACPQCSRQYRVAYTTARKGKGLLCPWCQKKIQSTKFNRSSVQKTPGRTSITPKHLDQLDMDDRGGDVVCAGPGERHTRPRGELCKRCEWRAFEEAI